MNIEEPGVLEAYLRDRNLVSPSARLTVQPLKGGVSNRTLLVQGEDFAWVVKQALNKLRVNTDWFSDPARIHREAEGIRTLSMLLPARHVAALQFEDETQHLLGMNAVAEPHENWKNMLMRGRLVAQHFGQFGTLLGQIHARAIEHAPTLEPKFADRRFFESLRLEPYYAYTASTLPAARSFLDHLRQAYDANTVTLVHGDYSPKNVLVTGDTLVLLDHEVMHWGDPAFDIGFAFAHLLSKANHLQALRVPLLEAAARFWNAYQDAITGSPLAPCHPELAARCVHHALACLLARVAGKSPLEYLTAPQQDRQVKICLRLLTSPPTDPNRLIQAFRENLR